MNLTIPDLRSLVAVASLALVMWSTRPAQGAGEAVNVLLIVADDLGWADLGCYGNGFHRTPALDRLAREGVRFTQAYAACPVCSPTRAAMLTGKYPARLHLTDWLPGRSDMPSQRLLRPLFRQELPLEETTLAERLRAAGYATAAIGKWHLGGPGFEPQRQGFDLNVAGDSTGSPRSYFAPFERNGKFMPGLEQAPAGEYLTDRLTAEAESFIEQHRDKPFFLYLAHYAVHIPLKAKLELVSKYKALAKPASPRNNPQYAAMLESLDDSVGRVLKKIETLNLTERTVIVFTSDNGGLATLEGPDTPATSNAPLREGKGYLYEGGLRVPLLVKWPGGAKPGTVCDVPVCSIDLVPTISEVIHHPAAKNEIDGTSFVPLLSQSGDIATRPLFWHYPHYSNQGGRPGGAIREGDYKLIEFYETGRRELFDLKNDPGESMNLIDRLPETADALAARLLDWRHTIGAQEMPSNPDYAPNPQQADGSVTLPAKSADVHGIMVRYEPLPHKNTLGFWVRGDDWVSWEFLINRPGNLHLECLQGCGTGSGGSEVDFMIADQTFPMTVEETGGFQTFVRREIGTVKFDRAGRYTLTVKPRKKPGIAVMDLREVRLVP